MPFYLWSSHLSLMISNLKSIHYNHSLYAYEIYIIMKLLIYDIYIREYLRTLKLREKSRIFFSIQRMKIINEYIYVCMYV